MFLFFYIHDFLQRNRIPYNILAPDLPLLSSLWQVSLLSYLLKNQNVFAEKLSGKAFLQQAFFNKELYHPLSEYLGKLGGVSYGYVVERAFFIDTSFQNDAVPMGIKSHHASVGLIRHEDSWLHYCAFCFIVIIAYDGELNY